MMSLTRPVTDIRRKRLAAGLPAYLVANRANIRANRFSYIERGLVRPKPEELSRIERAIEELARLKQEMDRLAAELGWPAQT